MKKNAIILVFCIGALVLLAGCRALDVIGNGSIDSFEALLEAAPGQVAADEEQGGWSLSAPDGSARFIWSSDYSQSPVYDVMLELEAGPFIAAGLDTEQLPGSVLFYDDKLAVGMKLEREQQPAAAGANPLQSYKQIVSLHRDAVGYHRALDHYGVSLGNGHMFEWARDLVANDKDMVFVLDPEPFIRAGVNPEAVEGWLYAKVPMHIDGKTVEVEKFLKPFDLQ